MYRIRLDSMAKLKLRIPWLGMEVQPKLNQLLPEAFYQSKTSNPKRIRCISYPAITKLNRREMGKYNIILDIYLV